MPRNVNDIIKNLSPARRKKIENRATQLIAEEMTRQELRRARERTQVEVAKKLGDHARQRFPSPNSEPIFCSRHCEPTLQR